MKSRLFAVDEWSCNRAAYFLTHMHSDHTQGLSASWCRGPLYCSHQSATLLLAKFEGFDPSLLCLLDLGQPTLVCLGSTGISMEVTALDADHCPGAVMYLFRGDFGCIMHTGDFRWENVDQCSPRFKLMKELVDGIQVDCLYLDNTFCHPSFRFPSRCAASMQVIEIINACTEKDVVIGVDDIGKEELLIHIANTLTAKICVWPERLQTMHLLGHHEIFTTDVKATRIRAVPRYSVSISSMKQLNELRPTVAILPTGLSCLFRPEFAGSSRKLCFGKVDDSRMAPERIFIHSVPYSLHSCFLELEAFVGLIKPVSIIGISQTTPAYNTSPIYYFSHYLQQANSRSYGSDVNFPCQSNFETARLQSKIPVRGKHRRRNIRKRGQGTKICYYAGSSHEDRKSCNIEMEESGHHQ